MIPTSATNPASTPSPTSALLGIASLILEGRALSDDEFTQSATGNCDSAIGNARISTSGSPFRNATNSSTSHFSSEPMESDPTLQHFQRIRQKLGQLRQSSPGTSRDNLAEQEIVVGSAGNNARAAAASADDSDDGELSQFVQTRKPQQPRTAGQPISDGNLLYTLQSLASTCLRTTPRPFTKNRDIPNFEYWFTPTPSYATPSKCFPSPNSSYSTISNTASASSSVSSSINGSQSPFVNQRTAKMQPPNRGEKIASPKQGPHCDQFLKKFGLGKGEASEAEEHICDMANLNEICYRWHFHCRQIEVIMSRCEPICIEVYLGPETHLILLEQWIIQQQGKCELPNITLQSLCNAIRSQLYFSQITAWTDLLRKGNPFDKEIQETGRVRPGINGGLMQRKPRLDIFYRIKAYDTTACFNAKPNVHNFPNIMLSENCTISVCLKSLPRLQAGIPKVGDFLGLHSVATNNPIAMASESVDQSTSVRDEAMMLDDRLNPPCQEKGKHKCVFDEEDGSSDALGEGCSSVMSHREKQLMKYRKRMMKRDRKSKKSVEIPNFDQYQPMQLEVKRFAENITNHCPDSISQQQAMHEFGSINSINSIRPPLYQITTIVTEAVQTNTIEMVSIGTQTADFPMTTYPTCENCGHDMNFVCWNCDEKPSSSASGIDYVETKDPPQKLGKADLLLQAIQRTPHRKHQDMRNNNNNSSDMRGGSANSNVSHCQLCKRQKTGHNYPSSGVMNGNDIGARDIDLCHNESNAGFIPIKCKLHGASLNINSTPRSHLKVKQLSAQDCGCVQHLNDKLESTDEGFNGSPTGSDVPSPVKPSNLHFTDDITAHFKTPKANSSPKSHLKPILLPINHSEKFLKSLPKVNLSNIFCSPSSPIPISSPESFSFDTDSPEIPVQKSNSAPTLPNSPSLSPRFLKQAAIYKRRSRHLSDRSSERSSFGSDEQYSDEDLDSLYSPADSPMKNKPFMRHNAFGRKPLLGNLEESLFQKRLRPKTQVAGFKVLLGASGAYCPTQLNIPATAYFFELSGQTLSTPYLCEIRLSRKGYTIPRSGTVQATLLNPLGTVVRMFVVPYDFRDMPPMSQTFIRQRILAIEPEATESTFSKATSSQNPSTAGSFVPSETSLGDHMHSLRYSIHLRFQTTRSGRLALHTDIRFLISRRTDCDTAAAHAKGALESPNDLRVITITPEHPKYSSRQENPNKI